MSTIRCVYEQLPKFPATDQHPDAVRFFVSPHWVDAIGGQPTQAEIDAVLSRDAVALAEAARKLAIRDDPLRVNLMAQLKTATAVQISNYVDANVTDLASARTMLKRVIFAIALDARNGNS